MKATLFGDYTVQVLDEAAAIGGSFRAAGHAHAGELLQAWHERAQRYAYPVVCDIGANTGSFTLLATLHPTMTVYAFEPLPEAFAFLCQHVALNGLEDRVFLHRVALADVSGKEILRRPDLYQESGLSTLSTTPDRFDGHTAIEVRVECLDAFDLPRVDMMKIDVEGSELRVIRGAAHTICENRPDLLIEWNGANAGPNGAALADIDALLRSWGASCALEISEDRLYTFEVD